jgi:hypothetical protein
MYVVSIPPTAGSAHTALFSFPSTPPAHFPRRLTLSFCVSEASFPSASFYLNAANIVHNGNTK